jgi:hypothetical protein
MLSDKGLFLLTSASTTASGRSTVISSVWETSWSNGATCGGGVFTKLGSGKHVCATAWSTENIPPQALTATQVICIEVRILLP